MRKLRRTAPETERRWLAATKDIAARVRAPYDVDLYLFGSRARGDARLASDIDPAVDPKGDFPESVVTHLLEEFDESTIPPRVDLVDLRRASPELRAKVFREGIRWIVSKSA